MKMKFFVAAAIVLSASLAARAESITYTESATASGSLGGVAFTDSLFTITGTADTANISMGPGLDQVHTNLLGTVAGVGSFSFTGGGLIFAASRLAGFQESDSTDILATFVLQGFAYDLQSPLSPTLGNSAIYNPGLPFATSDGSFVLDSVGLPTFSATTNPISVTPEPSSFLLLASGLLGIAGIVRNRLA